MNIMYWADGFWPRVGGIEVQCMHLIRSMQQLGHRFCVVAHQDYPSWPAEEVYANVQIYRVDFNNMVFGSNFNGIKNLVNKLEKIKNEFKPDLIHLHSCTGSAAFLFWILKKILDCPILLTVHGLEVVENKIDPMVERLFKSVGKVCCVSNALITQLNQYVDTGSTTCVYNGLKLPSVKPTPLAFDKPTVMMIGRLSSEKGLDTAVHAIAKVKKQVPNICLRIVGVGPEKSTIEKLVGRYNLYDTVELTGYVPPDDIPHMLNEASIVLTPSRFEAFCLSALQAMQMQRPVIATRVGGLVEVVTHGETGYLIEVDAVDELAEAIIRLIKNPEEAIRLGMNGRQDAIARFSIDRVVKQYHEIYTSLISQKNRNSMLCSIN